MQNESEQVVWQGRFVVAKTKGKWEYVSRARDIHKSTGLNLMPTIPRLQNSGTLIGDRLKI